MGFPEDGVLRGDHGWECGDGVAGNGFPTDSRGGCKQRKHVFRQGVAVNNRVAAVIRLLSDRQRHGQFANRVQVVATGRVVPRGVKGDDEVVNVAVFTPCNLQHVGRNNPGRVVDQVAAPGHVGNIEEELLGRL